MTREKALEAMDKLVAMGYHAVLSERETPNHVHIGDDGQPTSLHRWLEISEISMDKVDLRALIRLADELEFDVGLWAVQGTKLSFVDPTSEAELRKQAVVSGHRRHPR